MSQQKADANCNKEISFSSRFAASLGWFGLFWFSFLFKSIRFVESTGLHSLERGALLSFAAKELYRAAECSPH